MTPSLRTSYRESLGLPADSIPGAACERGDWDGAPGFKQHVSRIEEQALRNRVEAEGE